MQPIAVFILAFAARIVAAMRFPTEWDSVLLVHGAQHFDISKMSPHPPGYYLYVKAGRLLESITPMSLETSLVLLSAGASAGAVCLAFLIARLLRSAWFGWVFAAAAAASPVIAFYGSIIATYSFDLLTGFALIYMGMRARTDERFVVAAFAVAALGAGFRTSSLAFSAVVLLAIVVVSRPRPRIVVTAVASSAGLCLLWFVPMMLEQPGGFERWRAESQSMVNGAFGTTAWWSAPHEQALGNVKIATAYATITLIAFVPATFAAVIARLLGRVRIGRDELAFAVLAIAQALPVMLFVTFGHWGKAGYLLMFIPGALVLLAIPIARSPRVGVVIAASLLVLTSCVGIQRYTHGDAILPESLQGKGPWFTHRESWAPFPETLPARDGLEREMRASIELLETVGPRAGSDVLVLVDGNGGHRFAHVSWAFPDVTVDYLAASAVSFQASDGLWSQAATVDLRPTSIPVQPDGAVYALLMSTPPEVERAKQSGRAKLLAKNDYAQLWQLFPGSDVAGVSITTR